MGAKQLQLIFDQMYASGPYEIELNQQNSSKKAWFGKSEANAIALLVFEMSSVIAASILIIDVNEQNQ